MQTLWKEGEREGKKSGSLMHPSQAHRLPTALFLSLPSCLNSCILVLYGIVDGFGVWFWLFCLFIWLVWGFCVCWLFGIFVVVVFVGFFFFTFPLSRSVLGLCSSQCELL